MSTPTLALQAIFPEPVVSGAYRFTPPTLLHLAALDRLGVNLSEGRIGAGYTASAGFILTRTPEQLFLLMGEPKERILDECSLWASRVDLRDYADLNRGVVDAINAAFATAVPGAEADPQKGQPPISAGPSK